MAAPAAGLVADVRLGLLRVDCMVRSGGIDAHHVAVLAECDGDWPPILVLEGDDSGECLVIDGAHRVAAARQLGLDSIRAERFVGSADDALVEAIQRNVRHGLPLTMVDRRAGATRLLRSHPEWSDRRLAEVCALSARTVARLRRCLGTPTLRRVGRDGKTRPVEPHAARTRVQAELLADAARSNREIAAIVGTSRETVRAVRHAQAWGMSQPAGEGPGRWDTDRALSSSETAKELLTWLRATGGVDDWSEYVDSIPRSRLYELADEARRRAGQWQAFARALEARVAR